MEFNAKLETNRIIEFIKKYYKENKLKGAILGISGGKDSAVVAGLLTKALGKGNVIGLTLPCHSKEIDKTDAKKISDYYGFRLYDFDLTPIFDNFKENINNLFSNLKDECINSDINLKPRLRMCTTYYFAALMSSIENKPYLVVGTSNKSELFVGYFTKGGDSVYDIAPIADLTVAQVIEVGEILNVPKEILYKVPSDGISNLTDEDKLGVSYKDIETYLENPNLLDEKVRNKIKCLHEKNKHKFNIPTYRR